MAVDERYTASQGLYPHPDIDLKKLSRLILEVKLAPCHSGSEDPRPYLDECTICFLVNELSIFYIKGSLKNIASVGCNMPYKRKHKWSCICDHRMMIAVQQGHKILSGWRQMCLTN